jgi:dipeptidyl aminopeptidase/acylaminoacyl peptidase
MSAQGGEPRVLVSPELGVVANLDWAPDGKRLSYTLASPTRAADLYVVSLERGSSTQLTFSAPGGNLEQHLVTPEKIAYESFDGRTINAYLYKPHNIRSGERFPAIVLIHGGPTSHFADSYQLHAQFFTQQGYVMLLPNVRGSSGYGREFELLNNGDWGHGDRKDVVAGAEFLKSLPYVNPNKLGVEGTSYGGFLTPAVIAWSPGVFQAAIPISGYPNRVRFMEDGEYQHIQQLAYEFGPFEENKDVYYRNSPFFAIKNITTPTFLIHGEGRFPESPQMKHFADEMERHYKVFRYKAYQGETYYVRGRENTRQMLLDMLDFFDGYLKDDVAESGPAVPQGKR